MEMLVFAGAAVVKITIVMVTVLITVAILTLAERKILSWMQDRMGPMEVGPYGILQPLADGIKLFFKEDIVPAGANRLLFSLAPILSLVPALIGFAVVPYGPNREIELFGVTIKPFIITDINIGILYILAFTSIGAYGIILGGWASNNKYSLLGGLRAAAQVISYELNVGLAIISVMVLVSCIASVLFLGGYHAPYPGTLLPANLAWIEGVAWFTVKVYGFLFLFFWLRATLPRLRYDQLMRFGWKVMLPLALGNIVITAIVVYFLRD